MWNQLMLLKVRKMVEDGTTAPSSVQRWNFLNAGGVLQAVLIQGVDDRRNGAPVGTRLNRVPVDCPCQEPGVGWLGTLCPDDLPGAGDEQRDHYRECENECFASHHGA